MPNHITNILSVEGNPKAVKKFFSAINGGVDEYDRPILIDFNKITPMPESLNIESGSRSREGLKRYAAFIADSRVLAEMGVALGISDTDGHKKMVSDMLEKHTKIQNSDPDLWEFGKQCYENIANHGAPTWYEWSTANWGTKWNAYAQEQVGDSTISFKTAWSNVHNLIETLSARFPDLHFMYSYADEDFGQNVGQYEFENGESVFENRPSGGSPEAIELAAEVLGYDPRGEMAQDMDPC